VNREQFEHVIRAAGDVLKEDAVIIVGSQAILGGYRVIAERTTRCYQLPLCPGRSAPFRSVN
jgi:hypothetical protein